ncbi:hypothetical protein LTR78_006457 [Recurvomyces mirabilis]|uniref:RNase III domain-containing protein n=1 Tax=Recurvomyces mirabilis TaxID=574656 RepID=A0AAE1BZW5_9PEZI|nr:hypothetical protein LTR78_006457 [Recurvomyces mirabilis]KAK5151123.1 hypothetical protein LTS14_009619 [Recurvomyces mirabilis]
MVVLVSSPSLPLRTIAALRRAVNTVIMNNKRPFQDDRRSGYGNHKKQRHDGGGYSQNGKPQYSSQDNNERPEQPQDYTDAIAKLPPPITTLPPIPPYTPFTVPTHTLPPLPQILSPSLSLAPFRHKSSLTTHSRSSTNPTTTEEITYEKLEFLGDAQLELLASRLLYTRYPHLTSGQQSQLRELLVKNETLAEFARAYEFEKRVQVADMERMVADSVARQGNKGFNKVLGDVFEAYVAAVILAGGDEGWAVVEKWMLGLWAPKLVEAAGKDRNLLSASTLLRHDDGEGVGGVRRYNPAAKAELQKLILGGKGTKLDYEAYQKSVELKGDMLGQNRHFIAVYLTGYGQERLLLGKGEGKNKVEAGNWAAQVAMFGEMKGIVEECAEQLEAFREQRRREKEKEGAEEAAAAAASATVKE